MRSCWFRRTGQESDPTSWGVCDLSGKLSGYCATEGGSRGGGGFSNPSVPRSPGATLQEKAGRPMGPSTLLCKFPWELVRVCDRLSFLVLQVIVCF